MTNPPDAFIARATNLPASHPAIAMSVTGTRTLDDGTPVEFLWKPCIKVGSYEHPKLGKLSFTRDYLADVDRNTRQFIQDGGKPYVPLGHSNTTNLGWIRETKFDGETLFGLHEMIGQDAILAAKRNDSSVCIRNNYVGGNGRKYGPLLEHNCLTPEPVAMGLGGFVALSRDASGLSDSAPIFIPAAERNPHMPTADELAMARDLLGQPDLAEDKVFGMLIEAASTASRYAGEAEEASIQLSRATEEVTDLRAMLDKANGEVTQLSRSVPRVVDPEALTDRADAYMSRVELGVANGDIPPFIATGLKGVVLPKGKPSAYMLSRSEDFDGRPIDIVLDLFKGTGIAKKLAALGEQSGPQNLIPMSRTEPGTGDAPAQTRTNPYQATIDAAKKGAA